MTSKKPEIEQNKAKYKLLSDLASFFDDAHRAQSAVIALTKELPALSIEGILERALLLSKEVPSFEEIRDVRDYVRFAELGDTVGVLTIDNWDALASILWWKHIDGQRREFRQRLGELIKAPQKSKQANLSKDIELLRSQMLNIATISDEGENVVRYYPRTEEAAWKFAVFILYSDKCQRCARLRVCPQCDCYFLRKQPKTGGRPRDYCSIECQKKSDQKNALKRQKKPGQRAKQRQRRRQEQ